MSQIRITRIRTKMTQRQFILEAIKDMVGQWEHGGVAVLGRGFFGSREDVNFSIKTENGRFKLKLRKSNGAYELVAREPVIRRAHAREFIGELTRRYAVRVTISRLREEKFDVVSQEQEEDGRVHLVLRRMVG